MRKIFLIFIVLFAINARAQVIDKELKKSGSLEISSPKNIFDTPFHFFIHCAATLRNTTKPLLLVDGKRWSFDSVSELDGNSIDSISVMKSQEAIKKYGRKAKAGAVIIIMKPV